MIIAMIITGKIPYGYRLLPVYTQYITGVCPSQVSVIICLYGIGFYGNTTHTVDSRCMSLAGTGYLRLYRICYYGRYTAEIQAWACINSDFPKY